MGRPIRVAHIASVDLVLRFLLLDQLKLLRSAGYEVTAISAPGPWVQEVQAAGIRHIPWLHSSRSWGLRTDARAALELAAILRSERFDVVHTHNPKPGIMGRLTARALGVPAVIHSVHGHSVLPNDPAVKRAAVLALEAIAAHASDLELYLSEEQLQWARSIRTVGSTRNVLLGNGIDLGRFDPEQVSPERRRALRARLGIPPAGFVVGTMARFVAQKGLREFFAAASRIRQAHDDVYFLAVGGPDPAKSDALSADEIEQAKAHTIMPEWQADPREFISIMDVFVLATWIEGKPRSAMEAAALGKPLVLTDVPGCREVARDQLEALMIPPRDPDALAAAVERLRSDESLRSRLGRAARDRALEQFDQRPTFDVLLGEYRRLLRVKGLEQRLAGEVRIRSGSPADAEELAHLHTSCLPHGFMTQLGERFLRVLYGGLLSDPDGVCLVAECEGPLVGAACSVASRSGFYRRLWRRHGVAAAASSGPRLVKPGVVKGVLENLRYARNGSEMPAAEIISLAVAPDFRGHGVATRLIAQSLSALADRGVEAVTLHSAAEDEAAQRLFTGAGFQPHGQFELHAGRNSTIWVTSCRS